MTLAPLHLYESLAATVTYNANQTGQPGPFVERVGFGYPGPPPTPAPGMLPPGPTQTYPAGWNLVGGPAAWNPYAEENPRRGVWHDGPILTYQADDSDYATVPDDVPLPAGAGVWVYLDAPTTWGFTPLHAPPLTLLLPPGHWVTIANPGKRRAAVIGADLVYIYDPTAGSYTATTTLEVGQGAFVYSAAGSAVTISPASS